MGEKKIHKKIDKHSNEATLEDILQEIERLQKAHPELEVYFDGDEYAICSRPRRA